MFRWVGRENWTYSASFGVDYTFIEGTVLNLDVQGTQLLPMQGN